MTEQMTARAYYNRGTAKVRSGDHKGAITDYDKAIELNPKYAMAYSNRGVAKYYLGNHKGAVKDFDKVKSLRKEKVR